MYFTVLLIMLITLCVLIFLMYRPLTNAMSNIIATQQQYDNYIEKNVQTIEETLKNRQNVPLELLPNINLNASWNFTNEEANLCFATPLFVSTTEIPNFDCSIVCNNLASTYFFINDNDVFVVNGDKLRSGGYCSTSAVPVTCNRETSLILYSMNQWTCIPEDPRFFAGEANSRQIAGRQHADKILPETLKNNILVDNLLQQEVDITRNTFRVSWDEKMANGMPRFTVQCHALDINYNAMFVNPLNPIECLPNICTNVSYIHTDVKPNFNEGTCDCGDYSITRVTHVEPGNPSSYCAGVVNSFDKKLNAYNFRVKCLRMNDLVDKLLFENVTIFCPPSQVNSSGDSAYQFSLYGVASRTSHGLRELTWNQENDLDNRITYLSERAQL